MSLRTNVLVLLAAILALSACLCRCAGAARTEEEMAAPLAVVRHSPAGAGQVGKAVVTRGDDWWLPEQVEWSRHGAVVCGYGEPWGSWRNWTCSGQAVWCTWKSLQKEPGKLDSDALRRYLDRYGSATPPPGKRRKQIQIYVHGTDCGAYAPAFIAQPPFRVPTYDRMFGSSAAFKPSILRLWRARWNAHLEHAYPFWQPGFIERRREFHTLLAQFLASHPHGDRVQAIDLMGEFGTLWMYEKHGLVSMDTIRAAAEPFVRSALDSGWPAEKWLIPLGVGGKAYQPFADLALKYRTGIGNHGARGIIAFQWAQHLAHLRYDPDGQTYRWTMDRIPYAFFHTDCEGLDHTDNTLGQYKLFRFWCLAAATMGVDHILVSSTTIPSLGRKVGKRKRAEFHWDRLAPEGALQFVEWMNRTLGRPAEESPDAYVCLMQSGTPIPEGVEFHEKLAELKPRGGEWRPFPKYMKTPLIAYWGRFCELDVGAPGAGGKPVLKITNERIGPTKPAADIWTYGDGVFEARATQREAGADALYFRLDDRFLRPGRLPREVVVKVAFANVTAGRGAWRLEYDGANGWTHAPEVVFTPEQGRDTFWTATLRLTDARFANAGPNGSDFALRAVRGADAAFSLVRVIKCQAAP